MVPVNNFSEIRTDTEWIESDDLKSTGPHLMEVLGLILTYDLSNTAGFVICVSPGSQNCCFFHNWPLIK